MQNIRAQNMIKTEKNFLLHFVQDTLKAFNNFKNKQKKCMK